MKRLSILALSFGLLAGASLSHAVDAPARPDGPPPRKGGAGGPGGGGPGGGGMHLIPRFAAEKLNLTDDQKKQVADLEQETKDKLAKILTPDQMKTLESARPPQRGPGGGGPGGGPGGGGQGGGPGGGGPGGPGGDQPPTDRPARPAK